MHVVEVIGVEPPCPKCRKTLEVVKEAVRELGLEGEVKVVKLDISSPEVLSKYGLVISPCVAIDGKLVVSGRVPSKGEVARILEQEIRK